MSTNFYLVGVEQDHDGRFVADPEEKIHIGKRAGAGFYCWDCDTTLCKGGKKNVHVDSRDWHKACPKCGKRPREESLEKSAEGRKLGFNKSKPKRKKGVRTCTSFSWAVEPMHLDRLVKLAECQSSEPLIEDEYGRRFSVKEFRELLTECPIKFTNLVGRDFG